MKLSRFRLPVPVLMVVIALFSLSACSGEIETAATTAAQGTETPRAGGTLSFYIAEPPYIIPGNLQDTEGAQVGQTLFDSLLQLDYRTSEVLPAVAETWETNADATVWTFHLRQGSTFHNGREVVAGDFKYAWESICNPKNESEIAYHLAAVQGYEAMQNGETTELAGVEALDDYTLEVTLAYPFADFQYVVSHPALGPVPKEEMEKDPAAYAEMPVGNGPYKMAAPWQHDQMIKLVRFDQYYGPKPYLDGIDFKIFRDSDTAFLEFKAGTLDFTRVPAGQLKSVEDQYKASEDGIAVSEGRPLLIGPDPAVVYLALNNEDAVLANVDVRRALSLGINRNAICDAVYQGSQMPASSIIPPTLIGYEEGAWPYSRYDPAQAKGLLATAGFPGGAGLPGISLMYPADNTNQELMQLVQADLATLGVKTKLDGLEWAAFLEKVYAGQYQIAFLGWMADYPIMDSFLYSLFCSTSQDDSCLYKDLGVDKALLEARKMVDDNERTEAYQAIVRTIGEDAPLIPMSVSMHARLASDRVRDLMLSPLYYCNFESCWLANEE